MTLVDECRLRFCRSTQHAGPNGREAEPGRARRGASQSGTDAIEQQCVPWTELRWVMGKSGRGQRVDGRQEVFRQEVLMLVDTVHRSFES